jgi:RimJ/RimL family protein N-acetyltransferase
MRANNIFQWDKTYPNESILREDIVKEQMYAGILNKEIVSAFVLNKEFNDDYLNAKWKYKGDDFIVLHRFCVNLSFQNKGIGTKTMLMIEEYVKNQGVQSIRLDTFSKNPFSLKMYAKSGYKKTGEANWDKGLFYIFEKIL